MRSGCNKYISCELSWAGCNKYISSQWHLAHIKCEYYQALVELSVNLYKWNTRTCCINWITCLYYANYFLSASHLSWANHNNMEWFMHLSKFESTEMCNCAFFTSGMRAKCNSCKRNVYINCNYFWWSINFEPIYIEHLMHVNRWNNFKWDENIVESVESMHMSSEMRTA